MPHVGGILLAGAVGPHVQSRLGGSRSSTAQWGVARIAQRDGNSSLCTRANSRILVWSERFRHRDSRKDRGLDTRVGEKVRHSARADARGGLGDGSSYQGGATRVNPSGMNIRRPSDGDRVAEQRCRSRDGEALPRPSRDVRWRFGSGEHRNGCHRGAPGAEHLGACGRLGMGLEVSVYCGTRDVMRPVFIRHGE